MSARTSAYRRGLLALMLGGAGVFFLGVTSPAAVVLGVSTRRAIPRSVRGGRAVPGLAAATVGAVIGAVGLTLWAAFLLRLSIRAEPNDLDPGKVLTLMASVVAVWVGSGVAAWLALRTSRRRPKDLIVLEDAD